MKPTIKVSIGGFAFNLENDACQMIEDYLKKLNVHFEHHAEGKEIISDVEYRMAELLQMRMSGTNRAVTVADASSIISIMGNPKDFDGGRDEETANPPKKEDKKINVQRRLFRDPSNKILGGVCSGLGSYFNIDPVIVRILFVALLVLLSTFSHMIHSHFWGIETGSSTIVLVYIILWIAMPKARTLEQKIAMTGKNPGIENVGQSLQQKRGSGVWKAIKVILGILIGIKLLGVLLAFIAALALFFGFNFNSHYPSFTTLLDIVELNQWDVKLSALMVVVLPLLGIGYLCYKLLAWKRFTVSDGVISLLAFIVLVGCSCYIGGIALNMLSEHDRKADAIETIHFETTSDTLYVQFPEEYIDTYPVFDDDSHLFYVKKAGMPSLVLVPEIEVQKETALSTFEIEIRKYALDGTLSGAQRLADNFMPGYQISDSLLVINPLIFNKQHPWNRQYYRLVIRRPANKKVVFDANHFLRD